MRCDDCKYLGVRLVHLDGVEGVNTWHACTYPLPFHVKPRATPLGVEHDCRTYMHMNAKALSDEVAQLEAENEHYRDALLLHAEYDVDGNPLNWEAEALGGE